MVSVLVGATVEDVGFDESSTQEARHGLLEMAVALVPALKTADLADARAGLRPKSPDDLPLIGRSRAVPGLIYATGHYRNGVLLAPLTAELVRRLVAGPTASCPGTDPRARSAGVPFECPRTPLTGLPLLPIRRLSSPVVSSTASGTFHGPPDRP